MDWRSLPIFGDRMRDALRLTVTRSADDSNLFLVSGGKNTHWTSLVYDPPCDCEDHAAREIICKHILAVLIREGHMTTLKRLTEYLRELH